MNAISEPTHEWPLARIIVPATKRVNIYSRPLRVTTCYAAVVVATLISKIWGWRVEVIDENNYRRGPRDKTGLPDHTALQREDPAKLVGFYCGLSSAIERVWDLAKFYKSQGAITIAGSWHAHNLPGETLSHNIDLVVHGNAEPVIAKIIANLTDGFPLWKDVSGVSYLLNGVVWHNTQDGQRVNNIKDKEELLNKLMNVEQNLDCQPYADFGLVKHAKIKIYPVSRIRGCGMMCEFCSVRGKGVWASPEHFFGQIKWLVETRNAKEFFVVDDRLEEDLEGTIKAFEIIANKYSNRLGFTVQMRLEAAKNERLMEVLHKAGVGVVCIGYESPIASELKSMHKGLSAAKMLEYTKIWRKLFRVHGMFMIGYPLQDNQPSPPAKEIYRTYKWFIKKARLDSVQILISGPVPGSDLERRMRKEARLFLPDNEMWPLTDGNFVLFRPIGITARELQNTALKLMKWFYGPLGFYKVAFRIMSFPLDWLVRGWKNWYEDWSRDIIRFGGHHLVKKWQKTEDHLKLLEKIEGQE